MKDMEKLESVIRDLELSRNTNEPGYAVQHYGEDIHGITSETLSNTIALLKAQEPRVMTLEEVKAKPDYAWIEKLDSKKTYIVLFDFTAVLSDLSSYAHTWNHYGKDELLLLLLYNKTWRCWTSDPTDEQREVTPWN